MNDTTDNSERQAIAQLESIREMLARVDNEDTCDEAIEQIHSDPLSIEVRTDWHGVGELDNTPVEYRILLCTGGPACRIIGELDHRLNPVTARIEHQDWGTPWTEYSNEDYNQRQADSETLLSYVSHFYFGE